jgi:dTDP-glucose 4,6-dehydratase
VDDHCSAIETIYKKGRAGESYNIGAANEIKNKDIAVKICGFLDEIFPSISGRPYKEQIIFTRDRPGHDKRYAVNFDKLTNELGWRPARDFDASLKDTVLFYLSKYKNPR